MIVDGGREDTVGGGKIELDFGDFDDGVIIETSHRVYLYNSQKMKNSQIILRFHYRNHLIGIKISDQKIRFNNE